MQQNAPSHKGKRPNVALAIKGRCAMLVSVKRGKCEMATREDIDDMIQRVAVQDRAAFEALYDATSARLFQMAHDPLKDPQGGEKSVRRIFVQLWQGGADAYAPGVSDPINWLIELDQMPPAQEGYAPRDSVSDHAPLPDHVWKSIVADAYQDSPKQIWRQLGLLPAVVCAGGCAVVLLLAMQFGVMEPATAHEPLFVARLEADDSTLVAMAAYDDVSGILFVERQALGDQTDRQLELWFVAAGSDPVSLGVLMGDPSIEELRIPEYMLEQLADAQLVLSENPPVGSTTTGPMLEFVAVGDVTSP